MFHDSNKMGARNPYTSLTNSPKIKRASSRLHPTKYLDPALLSSKRPSIRLLPRHHQSNWTLDDIKQSPPRRYASEFFLNVTDHNKSYIIAERGVPEGQESPADFSPETIIYRRKAKVQSAYSSQEAKQKLMEWARTKWTYSCHLNLPLPLANQCNLPAVDQQVIPDADDIAQSIDVLTNQTARAIAVRLGLDADDNYKVANCHQHFYAGKPQSVHLVMGSKAVYIALSQNLSLIWSALWKDMKEITVKWNYTVLSLKSVSSALTLDFANCEDMENCASWLAHLSKSNSCSVSFEMPFHCRSFWDPWLQEHTQERGSDMVHISPVYFEESMLISCRENALGPWKAGHMMYKWSDQSRWKAGYIVIKGGVLYQFQNAGDREAAIRMELNQEECRGYGRNYNRKRPYSIEIHFFKDNRDCFLLLAAASEADASEWLNTLSESTLIWQDFVVSTGCDPVKAPTACGLIVTQKNVILFQLTTQQRKQMVASVPLDTVPAVMTSPHDTFCLVEFDYREAVEGAGGDWILYFHSLESLEGFLQAAQRPRQILSPETSSSLRQKSTTFALNSEFSSLTI